VRLTLHTGVCHRRVLSPEVELVGIGAREVMDRVAATGQVPR
jgi:hypothetical protein